MAPLTEQERDNILISMNKTIKAMDTRLGNIEADLSEVKTKVAKIDSIDSRLGNVEADLSEVKTKVAKVDSIDSRLTNVERALVGVNANLYDLKVELAQKPDETRVRQIVREELENSHHEVV